MKAYIRNHLKIILAVTIMLIGTGALIVSNEIRAQILPVLSEELSVVYCEVEKDICDYNGEEIENGINRIIFEDEDENRIVMYEDEFEIKNYMDNVDVGQASIEVSVEGYQGTIVIKNAFTIQPAQATSPQVVNATRELIDLTWEEVIGADGYLLYKSKDNGKSYTPIKKAEAGETLAYQDTDVALNEVYLYYIRAYESLGSKFVFGNPSEVLKMYTPLDNPMISDVKNTAYNTLQIEWAIVNGAAGYQVYRSDKQDGEYTLLAEIADGMAMSYADVTCECGKVYYYYIKACQKTDTETLYGEASDVVSGKTTPEKTNLRGATSENETKVTLTWKKVAGAQGYEVYKDDNLVAKIENADTLTWTEAGLSKDVEATYKVRAYCVVNNEVIYGYYSKEYVKEVIIETNYSTEVSGDLSSVTKYAGYPYVYGGTTPRGWDCSGFTQWVFKNHFGISLGRTSSEQVGGGVSVSKNDRSAWKPGDLLFYKEKGRVSHVAIYLGNGQMIHALSEKHDTLIQGVDYYETWDSKTSLYCVKRYF